MVYAKNEIRYSSSTVIVAVGHDVTQAIQRIHSSSLTGKAFSISVYSAGGFCSSKTSTGQIARADLKDFHFMNGAISVTDDSGVGKRSGPLPPNTSIHGSSLPSSNLGLGSIRIPLVMRGPSIKKKYFMKKHFHLIDIALTVSHILNMPVPAQNEGSVILEALL